jgi:IS5 family transposase
VPRQRDTRAENATIKDGAMPAEWERRPARRAQKDIEARWRQKHGKNHIAIDVKHKFIRRFEVTDAAVHDSQCFAGLLDGRNRDRIVYADSAYRSKEHERLLKRKHFASRVHHRAWKDRPLSRREQRENRARSRIRAGVEHVFGPSGEGHASNHRPRDRAGARSHAYRAGQPRLQHEPARATVPAVRLTHGAKDEKRI